jgi:hypothetical protein
MGGAMTDLPELAKPTALSVPHHDSIFIRRLITGIGFTLLGLWAVIGFLLWVPLMGRMIAIFFSAIISTMFTGRDPTQARMALDYAVTFYSRGFELIDASMSGTLRNNGPFLIPEGEHLWRVLRELLFAILFWLGIIFFWKALTHGIFGFLFQWL